MGNHEFCTRCGESDFHSGFTCEEAYPKQLKKYQAKIQKAADLEYRRNKAAEKLVKRLKKQGIDARMGRYDVEIPKWTLVQR